MDKYQRTVTRNILQAILSFILTIVVLVINYHEVLMYVFIGLIFVLGVVTLFYPKLKKTYWLLILPLFTFLLILIATISIII